jgi:large subunit ribosomal protein L5
MQAVEEAPVKEHPMRQVRLEKVTVHIGVGQSGEALEKAKTILGELTGQKPSSQRAKRTVKDFGIREGEPIACKVTLRREKAVQFMKRALEAVGNRLSESSFDQQGNFAFGVKEHIEIPGTKYLPELGIVGLDVVATMERPGFRVKRRRIKQSKVGKSHLVTKQEAIRFVRANFGTEIAGVQQ